MKNTIILIFFFFLNVKIFAQWEVNTSIAVNKREAFGMPISVGYEKKLYKNFYTKTQFGFKKLHAYNDFVEVNLYYRILEVHQTISYSIVNNKKYKFRPNIGLNFRYYNVKGVVDAPFNTPPQRAYTIDIFRNQDPMRLNSYDGSGGVKQDKRNIANLGFSIQFQNQFKLTNNVWLTITPFVEPDYDKIQNTGGVYVGVLFLKK